MAGLDPAIHVFVPHESKTWMPGSSPGMTEICANLSPPSLRAKRSNPPLRAGMDGLLRRFAPLRKRFAFVAGNDVERFAGSISLRQPAHHLVELLEIAVADLNGAAGIAVVDGHSKTERIADALFQRDRVGILDLPAAAASLLRLA